MFEYIFGTVKSYLKVIGSITWKIALIDNMIKPMSNYFSCTYNSFV